MENKVLENNLSKIRKYDPELVKGIEKASVKNLELTKTQLDEYNLSFKGKKLHSDLGAQAEAVDIAKNISNINEKNSICIIFGLGLGYLFDEAVAAARGKVVLFEPSLEILRAVLEIVELEKQLDKDNVFICNSVEKLKEHVKNLSDKDTDITISFLDSYRSLFGDILNETAAAVQHTHGEEQALENTLNKFSRTAAYAVFINLENIKKSRFIKELEGRFKDKPAIIVSAGPSLEKNIDIIKQNKDKAVIITVGTAVKALLKNGITPDFLCMIETKDTTGQVEGLDLSQINLVLEPFVHSFFWESDAKNKFLFCSEGNFLNNWLAAGLKVNNNGLFSIGTVSYCALSTAKLLGANPIILVGQDLAYTDKQCYSKGSAYEELVCELDPKTQEYHIFPKDYEKYKQTLAKKANVENYLKHLNENLYTVKGQSGEPLPTQSGYAIFIKHFEKFANENPSLTLINASIGGAQINGYKNIPLSECPLGAPFDKFLDGKRIEYDLKNLDKATNKVKELTIKGLFELENILNSILKAKKEFRPKNIEKAVGKLHREMQAFNDNYFEKSEVLYFTLYRNFTLMAKFRDDLENLEKYTMASIGDLKRLDRYLGF